MNFHFPFQFFLVLYGYVETMKPTRVETPLDTKFGAGETLLSIEQYLTEQLNNNGWNDDAHGKCWKML